MFRNVDVEFLTSTQKIILRVGLGMIHNHLVAAGNHVHAARVLARITERYPDRHHLGIRQAPILEILVPAHIAGALRFFYPEH